MPVGTNRYCAPIAIGEHALNERVGENSLSVFSDIFLGLWREGEPPLQSSLGTASAQVSTLPLMASS